jgi:hypothetical protein
MKPEGSLPCPREPTTDPYPEPDASSQQLITLVSQDPFSYYIPIYA